MCSDNWNFKRFIYSYLEIEDKIRWKNSSLDKLVLGDQIKVKRLAAVVRAYTGKEILKDSEIDSLNEFFRLQYEELQDACNDTMFDALHKMFDEDKEEAFTLTLMSGRELRYTRSDFCRSMFNLIREGYQYINSYKRIVEAPSSGVMVYRYKKAHMDDYLEKENEKFLGLLQIIMGPQFKQEFSVEELIANYGYPTMTDDEIAEWEIDNM